MKIQWFRRKTVWRPTWQGWLLILVVALGLLRLSLTPIYRFLAPNRPIDTTAYILEGWLPDHMFASLLDEVKSGRCKKIFSVGGPVDHGAAIIGPDWATVMQSRLVKAGVTPDMIVAVPAPRVRKDRTYASGLALKNYFKDHPDSRESRLNIFSEGPHARRSRLLFGRALGSSHALGVFSIDPERFNGSDWWMSSEGFRSVLSESLAYFYAAVLFRP